ncbi:MAG: serine/threonine protein kinase, partial [Pirellulales bacterium]
YYLLTGRPPFEASSVLEIIRRQVEDTPARPSEKSTRAIAPELEAALMACLEKSPDKRPQGAAQLAAVLSNCVPREPWTAADAERWWRDNLPGADSAASVAATEEIQLGATVGFTTVPRKA